MCQKYKHRHAKDNSGDASGERAKVNKSNSAINRLKGGQG